MKLSTKVRYGVRALVDLALYSNDQPVLVQAIAERQNLSRKYLENLLVSLKSAGIVRSLRGARGGYILARPAREITLEMITNALEGPTRLIDCVDDRSACDRIDICSTRDFWKDMTQRLKSLLKETTLEDLVKKAREKEEAAAPMYYI
jgi:Rrf2 family protein